MQIADLGQIAASNMLGRFDAWVQRKLSDCAIQTLAIGLVQERIDVAKVIVVPKESGLKLALSAILKLNALTLRNSVTETCASGHGRPLMSLRSGVLESVRISMVAIYSLLPH